MRFRKTRCVCKRDSYIEKQTSSAVASPESPGLFYELSKSLNDTKEKEGVATEGGVEAETMRKRSSRLFAEAIYTGFRCVE